MSENQKEVSHKEFETRLVRLPVQIFMLIAENDENVDTNEWMAFIKILKEKKVCDSPYARGVLGKTEDKLQALKLGYERKEIKNDPEEIKKVLQRKVDNKLRDNGINKNRIEVIVISAFYSKDFEVHYYH